MNSLRSHIHASYPGEFPLHALPPKAHRIAAALIRSKEVSPAIVAPILNNGLAFAVSPRVIVKLPGGGRKPVNNMTWTTSPSTSGRSLIADIVYQPFHDRVFAAEAERDIKSHSKVLFSVFHNATPEAMIVGMPTAMANFVIDDESTLVRNTRFLPNIPMFIKGYDDVSIINATKGSGRIAVQSPNLGVVILGQNEVTAGFDARHGLRIRSSGLASRCLIVHIPEGAPPRFMSMTQLPDFDPSDWHDLVNSHLDEAQADLDRGVTERHELGFDAQAARCLLSIHNEYMVRTMPGGDLAALPEHGGRQMEIVARMAGKYHAVERMQGLINAETVERAAEVVRWHSEHYKLRFLPKPEIPREHIEANCLEHALHTFVQRSQQYEVKRNDLLDYAANMGLSRPGVERALVVLCSASLTRIVPGKGNVKMVALNPNHFRPNYWLR